MKIKHKEEIKPVEPSKEIEVDSKLELLKYTADIQSRIKDDISSDFTLAKLEAKDKEGIIEMTSNAYFCKKVADLISEKCNEYGRWVRTRS